MLFYLYLLISLPIIILLKQLLKNYLRYIKLEHFIFISFFVVISIYYLFYILFYILILFYNKYRFYKHYYPRFNSAKAIYNRKIIYFSF